jgi:predicted PurR-regulated permease PerM
MGIDGRVHTMLTESSGLILPRSGNDSKGDEEQQPKGNSWSDVPWRTILATVGVVVATYAVLTLVLEAVRIIAWVATAGFFAIVLAPLVKRVQRRVGDRRAIATGVVVFATLFTLLGALTLFILPVRTQLVNIITDLPGTVHDAARGKGPVGNLVTKLHVENYVKDNESKLATAAQKLSDSKFSTLASVFNAALAFITVTLITFLFLSQSAAIGRTAINLVPHRRRASFRRIATEAAAAVSGYVIGNLIISLIAGGTAFVCLVALGVPSPVVLALFVAFADLIPLVGATIGAAVSVLAAYLYSPTAGIVSLIFFIVYQQVENGLIYPWIMARKVNVNPLVVLLSVLAGAELFGVLGALLAVPVSGAVLVIVKSARLEYQREALILPAEMDDDDAHVAAGVSGRS